MQRSCKSGTSSSCLSPWLQSLAGLSHSEHVVSSPLGLCWPSLAAGAGQETQEHHHTAQLIRTTCGRLVIQATYKTCLPGRTQHPCPSSNSPRLACLPSTGQRCKDRRTAERFNPWTWTAGTRLNSCQGKTHAQVIFTLPNPPLPWYQACKKHNENKKKPNKVNFKCANKTLSPCPKAHPMSLKYRRLLLSTGRDVMRLTSTYSHY